MNACSRWSALSRGADYGRLLRAIHAFHILRDNQSPENPITTGFTMRQFSNVEEDLSADQSWWPVWKTSIQPPQKKQPPMVRFRGEASGVLLQILSFIIPRAPRFYY